MVSSDLCVRTTGPRRSDSARLTFDLFHYYIPINDLAALLQVVATVRCYTSIAIQIVSALNIR